MKIVDRLKSLKDRFSYKQKIGLLVCAGILVGLGGLFMYLLRAHTYIADDPSACVNCHIMTPYYATWSHSSHGRDATCNDCHVPHSSLAAKYGFKAMDGLKHTAYFVTHSERQAIMAEDASAEVIMDNCIRCQRAARWHELADVNPGSRGCDSAAAQPCSRMAGRCPLK